MADTEVVLAELIDDAMKRLRAGQPVPLDEYAARCPEHIEELRELLPTLEVLAGFSQSDSPADAAQGGTIEGTLGDFRICREIGRGGMGVVYEAQQISLRRRVALKVLPFAAMLDPRHLQRFRNEAQAAASLSHPNIVHIYSVGCERGVHYYAMEYIEGQTLAQVIEELRVATQPAEPDRPPPAMSGPSQAVLCGHVPAAARAADGSAPTEELAVPDQSDSDAIPEQPPDVSKEATAETPASDTRPQRPSSLATSGSTRSKEFFRSVAQLGIQAAEALEHAHQMGVVHRDIKPSNLLIGTTFPSPSGRGVRGEGVGGEGAEGAGVHLWITDFGLAATHRDPALTMTGEIVGTLRYMSPEQAQGNRQVIDHHSDIYSLGVTLYELIALHPVFEGESREELLRQVLDSDPAPLRHHNPSVPADLETIIQKAMSKDPSHRYATAQELADDLRRFLESQPIRARRPTAVQRATKWSQRHRPAVWATGIVLLIALIASLVSTFLVADAYQSEKEQRGLAEEAASRERGLRDEADKQRKRAEANLQLALEVLDEIYARFLQRRATDKDGNSDKGPLLNSTLKFYERFAERSYTEPDLGPLVEVAYRKIIEMRKDLLEDFPDALGHTRMLGQAWAHLAVAYQLAGNTRGAEEAYRHAIVLQQHVLARLPSIPECRAELADTLRSVAARLETAGRPEEAVRRREQAERLEREHGPATAEKPTSTIRYSDFTQPAGMLLLRDACIVGGRLRLTPEGNCKIGGACYAEKQQVAAGFETTFHYRLDQGETEGFAFVIQNQHPSAMGNSPYSGLGYGDPSRGDYGIRNCVAIEIDTFVNENDVGEIGPHVSVQTRGRGVASASSIDSLGSMAPRMEFVGNGPHVVTIRYVPGTLTVLLDEPRAPPLTVPLDLETTLDLDEGRAWVGFTAAAGIGGERHEILSWHFRPLAAPVALSQRRPDRREHVLSSTLEAAGGGGRGAAVAKPSQSQAGPELSDQNARLLLKLVAFYRTFAAQDYVSDPDLRMKIGMAYWRVGDIYRQMRPMGPLDESYVAWDEACRIWRSVVEDFPDVWEYRQRTMRACTWAGNACMEQKQFAHAVQYYGKSLELMPARADLYRLRGSAYRAMGKNDRALEDYNKSLQIDHYADESLAGVVYELGDYESAIRVWTEIIRRGTNPVKALQARGTLYWWTGQCDKAIADITEAMRLGSKDGYNVRGKCYLAKGQLDKAMADFNEAARLDPRDPWARVNLARLYRQRGDLDRSLAEINEALRLSPDWYVSHEARGEHYLATGELDKAIADYTDAIALLRPSKAGDQRELGVLYVHRAEAYFRKGDMGRAAADCDQLLQGQPDVAEPCNDAALLLASSPDPSRRDPDRALRLARVAVRLLPNEGVVLSTLGVAQYRNGQWKEAIDSFNKSFQLRSGGDAFDWFFVAMAYGQLGQKDEAKKWFDQAAGWMEKNPSKCEELVPRREEAAGLLGLRWKPNPEKEKTAK